MTTDKKKKNAKTPEEIPLVQGTVEVDLPEPLVEGTAEVDIAPDLVYPDTSEPVVDPKGGHDPHNTDNQVPKASILSVNGMKGFLQSPLKKVQDFARNASRVLNRNGDGRQ